MSPRMVIAQTMTRTDIAAVWRALRTLAQSVRGRVWMALLLLFLLAAGQALINLWGIGAAARMLERAAESRQQLDIYEQLSADLAEYVLTRQESENPPPPASAEHILAHLDQLAVSTDQEETLLRQTGSVENDADEPERLQRLRGLVAAFLAGNGAVYHRQLHPLLEQAIAGERREVAQTEQRMDILRKRLRWLGIGGVGTQLILAILLAAMVGRAILRPVARLIDGLSLLEAGRLDHRITLARSDEFGLLAGHINRMASQLATKQRHLLEINEHLEKIVDERTASLQRKNEELKQIDDSRKRFFADVSHELRTPLTTIVAEADISLTQGTSDPAPYRVALESVLANAGYLKRRIEDLLAVARSQHGLLTFPRALVDLAQVMEEAVSDVGGLVKVNNLTLQTIGGDQVHIVLGDKSWLKQCLLTLLDNAVKFSRPGQRITVTLQRNGAQALLDVADQGEGIAGTDLPRLFERFYQTEAGQRSGGTGLGLSIARWIVEEHGGSIHASSLACRGTTIHMAFPLAVEPMEGQSR